MIKNYDIYDVVIGFFIGLLIGTILVFTILGI